MYYKDLDWVLQYGYRGCVPDENERSHLESMKAVYVPYAINQPALLAGILFVASRRYMAMAAGTTAADGYQEKMFRYKFICLRTAKRTVASEWFSSDATIALTLVLFSEAVSISFLYFRPC